MTTMRIPFCATLLVILVFGMTGCTIAPPSDDNNGTAQDDGSDTDADMMATDDDDDSDAGTSSNGSSDDSDDDDADVSGGTSGDVGGALTDAGAQVFADGNCATCHGADGSGGVAPSIRGLDANALDTVLRDVDSAHTGGTLPGLSDQDLAALAAFLGAIDASTNGEEDVPVAGTHTVDALGSGVFHASGLTDPLNNCTACHGTDLTGAGIAPSCTSCHGALWDVSAGPPADHTESKGASNVLHRTGFLEPTTNCTACHGSDLQGSGSVPSCTSCHSELWNDASSLHVDLLTDGAITGLHAKGRDDPQVNCADCHGTDLFGMDDAPACWNCHGSIWNAPPDYPPTHTRSKDGFRHGPGLESPFGDCDACHGADLTGTPLIPSCYSCHGNKWEDDDDD